MITLYQLKKTGKLWQWSVRTEGSHIITTYGYVNGQMQTTTETALAVNVGKKNEVSPVEQAKLILDRKVKEKLDSGYSHTQKDAKVEPAGLDYDNLPKSFTPAKPITSIDDDKLRELFYAERLIVQRKYDGLCMIASKGKNIHFLTRSKLEEKIDHFPIIRDHLNKLPEGTIIIGELISHPDKADNFKYVTSIVRTKASEEALEKQAKSDFLHFVMFDILHYAGEDVTNYPYSDRLDLLYKIFTHDYANEHYSIIRDFRAIEDFESLFGKNNIAEKNKFEGYVVWLKDSPTTVRLDGKEERIGAYKVKLTHTEDVWLEEPTPGKGKNEGRLGQVKGYQYTPDGKKIYVGDIGGGYVDTERLDFWKKRDKLFPCAGEIETSERLPSLKLRFPVFIRLRPDKNEKECIMQLMPRTNE